MRVKAGSLSRAAARRFAQIAIRPLTGRRAPFSAQLVEMPAGSRTPALHHARTAEFFLVLEGTQWARLGRRRLKMKAGDFAFLPPGAAHEFRAGPRGARVLAVFCPSLDLDAPDVVLS